MLATTLTVRCWTFQLRQIVRIGKTHMQVYRDVQTHTYVPLSRDICVKWEDSGKNWHIKVKGNQGQ